MTDLPTDAIEHAFRGQSPKWATRGKAELAALLADRDMWRNRSLAIEECISDFSNQWQQTRDYPSKRDEHGDTQ